jgi:NDP-sugar pyrophosphorylase family protein
MVRDFVGYGSRYDLEVNYSYEQELLGTAGAVKKMESYFSDAPFYVIYSDNFSRWDLRKLKRGDEIASPKARNDGKMGQPPFFIAVHWREDVIQSGMIEIAPDDRILRIVEKPKAEEITSHHVNAGFYYLHPRVLQYIPEGSFCDFGYHVFPRMIHAGEQLYAVKMDEPIIGIDTLEAYEKANAYAEELKERNTLPLSQE